MGRPNTIKQEKSLVTSYLHSYFNETFQCDLMDTNTYKKLIFFETTLGLIVFLAIR